IGNQLRPYSGFVRTSAATRLTSMVLPMPRGPTTSKCLLAEADSAFSFNASRIRCRHLCRTTNDRTSSLSPSTPGLYLKEAVLMLMPPLRGRYIGEPEARPPPVLQEGRNKRILVRSEEHTS